MSNMSPGFKTEINISHKWLIAILVILGAPIFIVSDVLADPSTRLKIVPFALLFYILLTVAWLLDNWRTWAAQWFTLISFVVITVLGSIWWNVPEFLVLLVIPLALTAALFSLTAAIAVAISETILIMILYFLAPGINLISLVVPLVTIWGILGVMYTVVRSTRELAQWSWSYYQQGQLDLTEAQARKVELEQALEDLAQANLQLTRLNLLAQGLRQAAEEARRAKEEFVANVSHELRTPLNMITGFSEMILQAPQTYRGNIPAALLADLTVIYRNAEHLADLVDDVLDLSQIEVGQMAITKELVQFPEIVEAAVIAVHPLYDSKGLYLKTDLLANLSPVFCDPLRMREVLLNLLSNAGRFTEQGGVYLRVWQENNELLVSVTDSGPGIAAEEIDRVFQPFHQVDGSIHRRYGGTGLGLSITERFIKLHGGKIWIESEKGVGTTFFFRLPVAPPAPLGESFLRGVTPGWEYLQRTRLSKAPKSVVRPRFVVLETGNTLQRLLTRYWHETEIVPVADIEAAIAELSRVPAQAVLVNDVSLSRSISYLSAAKTLPNDTPVITCVVSGTDELNDALDVSIRLVKPVSQDMLLNALDQLQVQQGTVLIVDDEPDALHLFGRMLDASERKYRVLLARDGQEALNILQECRPDVILLDLVMPRVDGFQLLEFRSQSPGLLEIPVIIISARDPAGQPIISSSLAATRGGGLSVQQLLRSIEVLSKVLAPAGAIGDLMPTAEPAG